MAARKHPEDSVIVSIGDVRDMLAEEVNRQHEVTQPRLPVPMAVPAEVVGGVPSWEEVGASRQARWDQERISPVPSMPPWRVWRRRMLLAGAALGLVATTAGVLWVWLPSSRAVERLVDASRAALVEASGQVALREAAVVQRELGREVERLRKQVQDQESALLAARTPVAVLTPEVHPVETTRESVRKPRVAVRRAAVVRADNVVRPRRPPRKPRSLNKTDAKLDSLLNGL